MFGSPEQQWQIKVYCINYRYSAETCTLILVGGRLQPGRGKCEAMMFEFFVRSHNVSVTPKDGSTELNFISKRLQRATKLQCNTCYLQVYNHRMPSTYFQNMLVNVFKILLNKNKTTIQYTPCVEFELPSSHFSKNSVPVLRFVEASFNSFFSKP